MCGFAGFARPAGLNDQAESLVRSMNGIIAHRGPDGEGQWVDAAAGIALGHRRLAIIDLSATGHQPMQSDDGRYVIAYNGEVYNFRELAEELENAGLAPAWRGHSDTEVLLAAIVAWGIKPTLKRAHGMFALALWDRRERSLTLARDRLGEKPLYYGWQGHGSARSFLFGSDLAALAVHPAFEGEIDDGAIELLLRYLYIPEPHSVYRGIAKLSPGTFLTLHLASGREQIEVYWDTLEEAFRARSEPFAGSPEEAVDALDRLLGAAVESQMVSDVPIGAFLSGGIDSSTVVALMQRVSRRPVKTFTIGFREGAFNEAVHARAMAEHLGTDHTELVLEARDALDIIPRIPGIYSEPFADSSQIPTFLVSRLAASHVTVALSGDAGDELFGGYNRHVFAHVRWPGISRVPRELRSIAGRMMLAVPPAVWDRSAGTLLRRSARFVGDKVHKTAGAIASGTSEELYERLITLNATAHDLMSHSENPGYPAWKDRPQMRDLSAAERMMALDAIGYLPGDILTKVDRAAMAVSLEARVPLLDPDVFRFAWSLPVEYKIRNGVSKWPLRQLLCRHVPEELVNRPKMGFAIPLGEWLRRPLREWAESLLSPKAIRDGGLFHLDSVQALWSQHMRGSRNNEQRLWPVLIAQAWLEHSRSQASAFEHRPDVKAAPAR